MKYSLLMLTGMFVLPIYSAAADVLSEAAKLRVDGFLHVLAASRADGEPVVQDNLDPYIATLKETVAGHPVVDLQTEYWHMTVAGDAGEVYSYGRKIMSIEEKARADMLTRVNALTEEAAFKIFLPVAAHFGQPLTRADYDIRFVDYQVHEKESVPEKERSLDGCVWEIRRNFTYKGIPCRERQLAVMISAVTGRIGLIMNKPMVVPQTKSKNVTREQAAEIASSWFTHQPYFTNARGRNARIREGAAEKTQWAIACPNSFFNGTQSSAERFVGPVAYYCWEVPFEYEVPGEREPHLFNAVVWVDADGGEVIGGKDVRE